MLLRLVSLALTSLFSLICLLPNSDVGKNLGILALRDQLAILQRQIDKPWLTTTARAFLQRLPAGPTAAVAPDRAQMRSCTGLVT